MNNLRQTGQKSGHRPPACTRRHVWSRVAELGWPGARSILLLQATATVEIRADPTTTGVSQPACGRGGSQSPPSVSFFPVVKSSAHAAALHTMCNWLCNCNGRVGLTCAEAVHMRTVSYLLLHRSRCIHTRGLLEKLFKPDTGRQSVVPRRGGRQHPGLWPMWTPVISVDSISSVIHLRLTLPACLSSSPSARKIGPCTGKPTRKKSMHRLSPTDLLSYLLSYFLF